MNASSHHEVIYAAPSLTGEDDVVLGEIHQLRKQLRHVLRTPRRWEGGLRRSALARAIQGSNSIEGYQVAEDDAAAAVDGEGPLSADEQTFLEIQGYRQALGYVLAMGEDEYAAFDATEIRAMHYMMLSHDAAKSPGRYRKGPVYVRDSRHDQIVYEGPAADRVPDLMDALVDSLHTGVNNDPVVRSAMAHLNLVMIHPFRDGNGRISRLLTLLALYQHGYEVGRYVSLERLVEESRGEYYDALHRSSDGWHEGRHDLVPWLSFFLAILKRAYRELDRLPT